MVDESAKGGSEGQPRRIPLGELLVQGSALTADQLAEALATPRPPGKKIGQVLVEKGWVTEAQLTQTLSLQLSVPWVSLYHIDFSRQLLNRVSRDIAERHCLIPIFVRHVKGQGETLYVAMDDPTNEAALVEVSAQAALPAKPMIASATDIRSAIRVYYGEPEGQVGVDVPVPPPAAARTVDYAPMTAREGQSRDVAPETPQVQTLRDPNPRGSSPSQPPPVPVRASQPPPLRKSVPPPVPGSPPASAGSKSVPPPPSSQDADKAAARRRAGASRLLNLTLLDGTTLALPKRKSAKEAFSPREGLTAHDYINALRAAAGGADASEVLGEKPKWEPVMAALLTILLRKGVVADWELVEELRKM